MFIFDLSFVVVATIFLDLSPARSGESVFMGLRGYAITDPSRSFPCLLFACLFVPIYLHFTFLLPSAM